MSLGMLILWHAIWVIIPEYKRMVVHTYTHFLHTVYPHKPFFLLFYCCILLFGGLSVHKGAFVFHTQYGMGS